MGPNSCPHSLGLTDAPGCVEGPKATNDIRSACVVGPWPRVSKGHQDQGLRSSFLFQKLQPCLKIAAFISLPFFFFNVFQKLLRKHMPIRVDPNDLFPPSLHTGLLAQADQAGGQHWTRWRRVPGAIQLRPRGHGGGRDAHPLPEVGQHLCHQTCVLPSGLQLTWGVWPENVQPSLNPQNSSLGAAVRAGLQAERVHPLGMAGAHVIEIVFPSYHAIRPG